MWSVWIPDKSELDTALPVAILREAFVRGTARWALLPLLAGWALLGYGLHRGPVDQALAAEIEPGGWFGINVGVYLPFYLGSVLLLLWAVLALAGAVSAAATAAVAFVALVFTWPAGTGLDHRPLMTHWAECAAWLFLLATVAAGAAYLVPGRVLPATSPTPTPGSVVPPLDGGAR